MACSMVAGMYHHGQGVKAEPSKAMMFYFRDCHRGRPAAFSAIGDIYCHGALVPENHQAARRFSCHACKTDDERRCAQLEGFRTPTR